MLVASGEPLSKQRTTVADILIGNASIPVSAIAGPSIRARQPSTERICRKKKKRKQKKYKKLLEKLRGYDVMSELANAFCSLNLGQLLRADANEAAPSLQRFISLLGRAVNRLIVSRTTFYRLELVVAKV